MTDNQKKLTRNILFTVFIAMEKDEDYGKFVDGGRITISMSENDMVELAKIIENLK